MFNIVYRERARIRFNPILLNPDFQIDNIEFNEPIQVPCVSSPKVSKF